MGKNFAETATGAVVVMIAFTVLYLFFNSAEVDAVKGYDVKAIFTKVGGLQPGSDVKISGINVGIVNQRILDPETYRAVVTLTIKSGVKVPEDTVATIGSEGIFGGKYVLLKPGRSKKSLSAGTIIGRTEDYRTLEDQVGEIIHLATGGESESRQ